MILLAEPISATGDGTILGKRVRYRPDLAHDSPPALVQALAELRPLVVVARAGLDAPAALAWRNAIPAGPLVWVCETLDPGDATTLTVLGIEVRVVAAQSDPDEFARAALRLAERTWTEVATQARSHAAACPRPAGRVVLVGAGIVNLVTAIGLVRDGHEVTVIDAAPDPRSAMEPSLYGCTSGGGNARMFTLTEADNYNDRRFGSSRALGSLLGLPASAGGWIVSMRPPSPAERRWLAECRDVPAWMVHNHTDDILSFNREAGELWAALRRDEPEIFEGVALRDGIVRLYDDADYFRSQIDRQRSVGALQRVLHPEELSERHPSLAAAHEAKICGAIEVRGFTLAVHDFVARILAALERRGVRLRFGERVHQFQWHDGKVEGVVTDAGLTRGANYVISPGVYGDDILKGTSSHGQIQGVLGVWLTVPNVEPRLEHSVKVSRRGHATEDTNITVANDFEGRPVIILGAGYGWVGLDHHNIDPFELEVLFGALEDTAAKLFPHAYATAAGALAASKRVCVRPWTSSSLGIFERLPACGGGEAIVTGAHNTGGFAQAPAVALAVVRALRGQHHAMHALYHPNRRRFLADRSPVAAVGALDDFQE